MELVLVVVMSLGATQEPSDLDASRVTADIVTLKHDIKVDRLATKNFSVIQHLDCLGFDNPTDSKY